MHASLDTTGFREKEEGRRKRSDPQTEIPQNNKRNHNLTVTKLCEAKVKGERRCLGKEKGEKKVNK